MEEISGPRLTHEPIDRRLQQISRVSKGQRLGTLREHYGHLGSMRLVYHLEE